MFKASCSVSSLPIEEKIFCTPGMYLNPTTSNAACGIAAAAALPKLAYSKDLPYSI